MPLSRKCHQKIKGGAPILRKKGGVQYSLPSNSTKSANYCGHVCCYCNNFFQYYLNLSLIEDETKAKLLFRAVRRTASSRKSIE